MLESADYSQNGKRKEINDIQAAPLYNNKTSIMLVHSFGVTILFSPCIILT